MHLIPEGNVTLPENEGPIGGRTVNVDSFYLDETQVTIHQYVDFLNQALSRIKVEKGVVRGDGEIWLLLGEVPKGYEPIVFRDGSFHVQNAAYSANPVLRVTGYGASAYVRFYGRRLVSEVEWLYVLTKGSGAKEESLANEPGSSGSMGHMHSGSQSQGELLPSKQRIRSSIPAPVILSEPNRFGIRGLNENVGEWGVRPQEASSEARGQDTGYVILGGVAGDLKFENALPSAVPRHPWEAFDTVGFRCAMAVDAAQQRRAAPLP